VSEPATTEPTSTTDLTSLTLHRRRCATGVIREKLGNTFFGSFLVMFPGLFYFKESSEASRKEAIRKLREDELSKMGVVQATEENVMAGKGRQVESEAVEAKIIRPEWDGKDSSVDEVFWWEKKK
tara:strand:- start:20 stop:394 length:375 start_codon:yes stop_codon:yes gene_type:complete